MIEGGDENNMASVVNADNTTISVSLASSSPAVAVQPSTAGVENPHAPDAPILHLLSLRENPNVATMSEDELRALVQRLRTVATSPQTLSAKLTEESMRVNPRQRNSAAAKRKAILADI